MTRALLLLLLAAAPAWAHRLHAEARLDGGEVLLEVYFSDGTAPDGAAVEVRRGETAVASGVADAQGRFRWRPPGPGRYHLVVTEPGLHKAQAEIDVPAAALAAVATPSSAAAPVPDPAPPPPRGGTPWGGLAGGLSVIVVLCGGLALLQRRRERAG